MPQFVTIQPQEYVNVNDNERTAKTWHGLDIEVNDVYIGRIARYKVAALTRKITAVRELGRKSFGRIVEQVPSIGSETQTIDVERVELWGKEMELAFGYPAVFDDLCDQTKPFTLYEKLYKGNTPYRTYMFSGCWFNSFDYTEMTAEGDAIIKNTAQITYTSRVKIFG